MRPFVVSLLLAPIAIAATPLFAAEPSAQSSPARECLRLNDTSFGGDWDERERTRKKWVEVCRQAVTLESENLRLKHVLARALTADGQREEAIGVWRELGERNDAGALFEIYDCTSPTTVATSTSRSWSSAPKPNNRCARRPKSATPMRS